LYKSTQLNTLILIKRSFNKLTAQKNNNFEGKWFILIEKKHMINKAQLNTLDEQVCGELSKKQP
jgi:hypothetical protein